MLMHCTCVQSAAFGDWSVHLGTSALIVFNAAHLLLITVAHWDCGLAATEAIIVALWQPAKENFVFNRIYLDGRQYKPGMTWHCKQISRQVRPGKSVCSLSVFGI